MAEMMMMMRDNESSSSPLDIHFLHNESVVVGVEFEAQLQKTILPQISTADVSKFAENFYTSSSCVIKTVEPQAHATIDELKSSVLKINSLEKERTKHYFMG